MQKPQPLQKSLMIVMAIRLAPPFSPVQGEGKMMVS
jgi:hypothetical protein